MSGLSSLIYLTIDVPKVADGVCITPVPCAGTVRQIMVAVDAAPTTSTLAITKTGAVLLTAAATVNLATLTANTGADQTLSAEHVALHLAKGDSIICTLDNTTAGSCTDIVTVVAIEPDYA